MTNSAIPARRTRSRSRVTHSSEGNARKFFRNITLTTYALVLVFCAFIVPDRRVLNDNSYILVAFVLSQCSMVGIWAASFRGHHAIAGAAMTLFSVLCWWTITAFRFIAFGDASEICWLIVVVTQSITTILATVCLDTFSKSSRRKRSDRMVNGVALRKLSFSVGNLILWTTFVAIGLLLVQWIMSRQGWSAKSPDAVKAMLAIGLGLGGTVFAAIWLAIFRGAIWPIVGKRFLIALPVFLFIPFLLHVVLIYVLQSQFLDPLTTTFPLSGQAIFNGLTLLATLNHTRR